MIQHSTIIFVCCRIHNTNNKFFHSIFPKWPRIIYRGTKMTVSLLFFFFENWFTYS
jgi:hypothetical protein